VIWVSAGEISHKKNLRSNVPLFENLPHQQPFLKGEDAVSDLGKISRIYSQNMSARTVSNLPRELHLPPLMRREEALLPGRHIIAPTLYAAAASGLQTNATPQKNTPKKKKKKKTKKNPLVLELVTDSRICR